VWPTFDTATETITDLLNVEHVRSNLLADVMFLDRNRRAEPDILWVDATVKIFSSVKKMKSTFAGEKLRSSCFNHER